MFDVVVIGGGVAGTMAAIAAARQGKRTALCERSGTLGGMWTSGMIGVTLDAENKGGLLKEFLTKVNEESGSATTFETKKYVLERMCTEAGVELCLGCTFVNAETENGEITCVRCASKSGTVAFKAAMYIDATGDGDVAASAGCEFALGNSEGKTQPMSMVALVEIVGGLDKKYLGWDGRENFKALLDSPGAAYSLGCPNISPCGGELYQLSINQEYGKSALNCNDVSLASVNARKEIFETVKKLRCGGMNITLVSTPEFIGVREGRRIKCLYNITLEDVISGARFPDAVCRVTYWVDIHSFAPGDKGYSDSGVTVKPYDIPLRAMLPEKIGNLVLAGRCIGGDFFAHASYRVMGNMASVGEAAGVYAAKKVAKKQHM